MRFERKKQKEQKIYLLIFFPPPTKIKTTKENVNVNNLIIVIIN